MKKQLILTTSSITLDKLGDAINIPVRYSKRAKHIIIKINTKDVELVLPNKNFEVGYKFLLKKESWIRQKLSTRQKNYVEIDKKVIPIFDKPYPVLYIDSSYVDIQIINDVIHVYSQPCLQNQVLIKFLQDKLLLKIIEIINIVNAELKLFISKIRIMNNKTRWGSCSSKAVLSFNWRLVFVPQEVLSYVIIHELCHLIEMNHSKSFWNLVKNLCPNYPASRLWLRQNSNKLYQYCNADT